MFDLKKIGYGKFWVQKLSFKKHLGQKTILGQQKNLGQKKIRVPKHLGFKKKFQIWVQKEFWVQRNFGSKKILDPKKFGPEIKFVCEKIWAQKKSQLLVLRLSLEFDKSKITIVIDKRQCIQSVGMCMINARKLLLHNATE